MKKIVLAALLAVVAVPAVSFAASPGGTDGCGLGWQVTNKKSFLGTTTRGTTNAVVPPTFGMTSGTIECDQHSFAKAEMPAVIFGVSNYDTLVIEMAAGRGETLEAFAQTLGCSDAQAFGRVMQEKFEAIKGNSALELYKNVKEELKQNAALGCAVSA